MSTRRQANSRLTLWLAFQAGLSSLSGAGVWVDVIGQRGAGTLLAISAACQVGTAAYVAAVRPVHAPEEVR